MIYTVTLNPSLDYIVTVEDFTPGRVNRTGSEQVYPGGKGINVSLMLANLGYESVAMGFLAGFTGAEIEKRLWALRIRTEFITVEEGMSRINVKLRTGFSGSRTEETEINGKGPVIDEASGDHLLERLEYLQDGDMLVLAGSIPAGLPDNSYEEICSRLADKGVHLVVDTTGEALIRTLKYHPFLIKPNHHELGAIFGVELQTREEVIPYAEKLQKQGASNVLVSLGGEGAVLLAEDGKVYQSPAPEGKVHNAVGAGDSMVAGFLAGFKQTADYRNAFLTGLCAGSASAFSDGLASGEEVRALLERLDIRRNGSGER